MNPDSPQPNNNSQTITPIVGDVKVSTPQSKFQKYSTLALNFFTLLLFFATATLAYLAYQQWRTMEKSIERTDKLISIAKIQADASASAAEAAKTSAAFAWKSTLIAQDAFELSERAYVGIKEVIIMPPTPGQKIAATVRFQNSGKTPARNTSIFMKIAWPPSQQTTFDFIPKEQASKTLMLPGAIFTTAQLTSIEFSAQEIDMIKQHKLYIYLYGIITYETLSRKHYTKFCYDYVPEIETYRVSPIHNDAN